MHPIEHELRRREAEHEIGKQKLAIKDRIAELHAIAPGQVAA